MVPNQAGTKSYPFSVVFFFFIVQRYGYNSTKFIPFQNDELANSNKGTGSQVNCRHIWRQIFNFRVVSSQAGSRKISTTMQFPAPGSSLQKFRRTSIDAVFLHATPELLLLLGEYKQTQVIRKPLKMYIDAKHKYHKTICVAPESYHVFQRIQFVQHLRGTILIRKSEILFSGLSLH